MSDLQPRRTEQVHTRWRRIVTPIPVPESLPIIHRLRAVEPASMASMPPVLWHEAEGFLVRDPYGNQWIDLTSGIVLANVGHAHPHVRQAILRGADQKLLATYAFPAQARLDLLEKLVGLSPIPDSKAILFSAGTEANECAMFLMRCHGRSIHRDKVGILSFEDGYHGKTLAAWLAAGSPRPTDWIAREKVYHYQIPFPFHPHVESGKNEVGGENCFGKCLELLEQRGIKPQQIAGILGEAMPGWATWPMSPGFAKAMADWAKQNDILVCFDEIQAGLGRAGKWFSFEHARVVPDLITLGKGLTSSVPVSAVLGPRWLMDGPAPGEMSSTHGGNPLCAAAAVANLEVIEDEKLVEASARTGVIVLKELQKLQHEFPDHVLSIHGRGLFISAHLKKMNTTEPDVELADSIAHHAVRRGVMMFVTGRGFLKFVPPLCIEPEAALEAVDVIRDCFLVAMQEADR